MSCKYVDNNGHVQETKWWLALFPSPEGGDAVNGMNANSRYLYLREGSDGWVV